MNTRSIAGGFRPVRRDELRQEREHDSYPMRQKPPEPSVCPDCGAVFHGGRWQWAERPAGSHDLVCPACHRIHDHFPAGFVHVAGAYFREHREALTNLLHHHEAREKAEHPMARIMGIEEVKDGILVSTTDIHLARNLGEALHHACQGTLEFHYNDAQNLLRVSWRR